MIFGQGGAGGVVNRDESPASASPRAGAATGAFDGRRFTLDVGRPLTGAVAIRLNGMRGLGQLPLVRRPQALRRQPDRDDRAERPSRSRSATNISMTRAGRRHHLLSGPPAWILHIRNPAESHGVTQPGVSGDQHGRGASCPHDGRQLRSLVSELRARRRQRGSEPVTLKVTTTARSAPTIQWD